MHCILAFPFTAKSHQGSTNSCTYHFDKLKVENIDFSNGLRIADTPKLQSEKHWKIINFMF